jgi:hypothetical protein
MHKQGVKVILKDHTHMQYIVFIPYQHIELLTPTLIMVVTFGILERNKEWKEKF